MKAATVARSALFGAAALGVGAAPALATPTNYSLLTTIAVPTTAANRQPGGAFTSFDISYYDPATNDIYIADRSNAAVDIVSGSSLTVVGQATGFTGQAATTSVSGPDGVVAVTNAGVTTLYAGDGNSTMKVFNVTNPASPTLLQSVSTGGTHRVDEMAYSPATKQILAANNADQPAYGTIFNVGATPVTIAHSNISIPGAGLTDGLEQPLWNPNTGSFFISVPSFNGDQGGVAEIKTDGTVGQLYKFSSLTGGPATCSPAGLALGASGNIMVGCSVAGSQTVLLNPTANGGAGAIVKTFTQVSGSDELWYDPNSQDFFVTGSNASGNRVFDVINDPTQTVLQEIVLPVANASNPHSITVDSLTGDVFVPLAGSTSTVPNTFCPLGCVAVYAQNVPEPASLPLVSFGIFGLFGLIGLSRLRGIARPRD